MAIGLGESNWARPIEVFFVVLLGGDLIVLMKGYELDCAIANLSLNGGLNFNAALFFYKVLAFFCFAK